MSLHALEPVHDRYKWALEDQAKDAWLVQQQSWVSALAVVLVASGNVFVLSSMYQLGITGTYLGIPLRVCVWVCLILCLSLSVTLSVCHTHTYPVKHPPAHPPPPPAP